MSEKQSAYPLAWPQEWPRTKQRKAGRFSNRSRSGWDKSISLAVAVDRLLDELRAMRAKDVVVSTDLLLRNDGFPRSGQKKPADPGVAVYFKRGDAEVVMPCDTYTDIAQNVAAIAASIAAMRTLDRHVAGYLDKAFTGFEALPSPDEVSEAPWRNVLMVGNAEKRPEFVRKAYKLLRSHEHPDKGGDPDRFDRINRAWKAAQQELDIP